MGDRPASIHAARMKRVENEIGAAIESVLDRELADARSVKQYIDALGTVRAQLAGALCSTIDHANDQTHGTSAAPQMRDFLSLIAEQLDSFAKDRDEHQPLGAHVLRSTASQLRDCAKGLDDCAKLVADMVAAAKEMPDG